MRRWAIILFVAAAAAIVATHAAAHAKLERAVPAPGSTLRASPPRIELSFSQRLEPAFSSVRVTNSQGTHVDSGDASVDRSNGRRLVVSMPPLSPGSYRVRWRALSVDTHVSEGQFTFDVEP